jgi:FtsZ-binding cell division protein ZapB
MNLFKNKNCDDCVIGFPQLRSNQDLHSDALKRQDVELKNIKEHMRKMTEDIRCYQGATDALCDENENLKKTIKDLQKQINVLTILAYGEPKNIASYQWIMWEKAKDELYPHYSTARDSLDKQVRINSATERYYALKSEMEVLKEDYEHLRKL